MNNLNCEKCPLYNQCKSLVKDGTPPCAGDLSFKRQFPENDQLRIKEETRSKLAAQDTVFASIFLVLGLIVVGMAVMPRYGVYSQRLKGAAILAHAQSSREVAVAEAKAKMEFAVLLAAADTLRAWGVARSNRIIGASLTDAYLRWFRIAELKPGGQVIYVPTEANLPILEATRK